MSATSCPWPDMSINDWLPDVKMILKTLRRTARKIVARTRRAMKVNSKSSGLKLTMRWAPMGV